MNNKAIISHPYSGAIQEFFTHQLLGKKWGQGHPYYKTLWGSNASSLYSISLTLFACYDEVVFSPVDNVLPDVNTHMGEDEYYHPDLGLRMPSGNFNLGFNEFEYVDWLVSDKGIQHLLLKVPESAKKQILTQVVYDMELAIRYDAEIISSTGRKLLMERISLLDPQFSNVRSLVVDYSKALTHYSDVVLPDFEISNLDLLYKIKSDKDVRSYGKSFVKALSSMEKNVSERDFAIMIKDANLKNAKNQSINKFTGWTAQFISSVGVAMTINPVLGATAVALGETSRVSSLSSSKWVELKPRMVKIKDAYELDKFIESKN